MQLARSIDRDEVHALYQQAGLSLDGDLRTLDRAARIAADPRAVSYLSRNITLRRPGTQTGGDAIYGKL